MNKIYRNVILLNKHNKFRFSTFSNKNNNTFLKSFLLLNKHNKNPQEEKIKDNTIDADDFVDFLTLRSVSDEDMLKLQFAFNNGQKLETVVNTNTLKKLSTDLNLLLYDMKDELEIYSNDKYCNASLSSFIATESRFLTYNFLILDLFKNSWLNPIFVVNLEEENLQLDKLCKAVQMCIEVIQQEKKFILLKDVEYFNLCCEQKKVLFKKLTDQILCFANPKDRMLFNLFFSNHALLLLKQNESATNNTLQHAYKNIVNVKTEQSLAMDVRENLQTYYLLNTHLLILFSKTLSFKNIFYNLETIAKTSPEVNIENHKNLLLNQKNLLIESLKVMLNLSKTALFNDSPISHEFAVNTLRPISVSFFTFMSSLKQICFELINLYTKNTERIYQLLLSHDKINQTYSNKEQEIDSIMQLRTMSYDIYTLATCIAMEIHNEMFVINAIRSINYEHNDHRYDLVDELLTHWVDIAGFFIRIKQNTIAPIEMNNLLISIRDCSLNIPEIVTTIQKTEQEVNTSIYTESSYLDEKFHRFILNKILTETNEVDANQSLRDIINGEDMGKFNEMEYMCLWYFNGK